MADRFRNPARGTDAGPLSLVAYIGLLNPSQVADPSVLAEAD
jgi:hypothetical protein